jgi:hypothetical protein
VARTPDRFPGVGQTEGEQFEDVGIAAATGGDQRYKDGAFSFFDAVGEYDPRAGLPAPTAVGQLLFSVDGVSFKAETPLTSVVSGWLVLDSGVLLVNGGG